ncbi:DNA ligase D [Aquincola sp. J276]|uniref:DNA ligase D n=1 Tax=Aquincola sp. J276 TaxID=2898432 RepID=UPI0021513239|nr:DNA ligase D [Aquincola sp. J276]MCR5867260.1 DNA ligase D [Aquincola sp. J276]
MAAAKPFTAEAPLARYNAKRNFQRTAEPAGLPAPQQEAPRPLAYVIQKHWASRLHYDFRLELDGVLLSWAVPKGPSFDPAVKQMAIQVEDHPLAYGSFEGTIPKGQYGAGTVIVWDQGSWEPVGDARAGLQRGKLLFKLHGQKLAGLWELVRISKPGSDDKQPQWMLFKKRGDAWARPTAEYDVISALPDSVVTHPLGLLEQHDDGPDLSAARRATLPARLAPQLATLAAAPPATGPDALQWVAESKFDGYRMLARIQRGAVRLITRNGHDWSDRLPGLVAAVQALGIEAAWLDGEIVVMNDAGVPDFNRLQNAIDDGRGAQHIVYFVFDLPYLGDQDLRAVPLRHRRAVLQALMAERADRAGTQVQFSQAFDAPPAQLLAAACRIGLEGVILKQADAPYVSGRTETWLKLKCQHRQEFVVVGFTDRAGARAEVGSLLLAYHEAPDGGRAAGALRSAGSVGTGWSTSTARELHQMLLALETSQPAIDPATVKPGRWSRRTAGSERWVRPELVVEVAFAEWTPEGHVRHATFRGVRSDKPAREIRREQATASPATATATAAAPPPAAPGRKVTNPQRVIDPSTGITKLALVRYYESIAPWMLPHLKDRPVSLVRAPQGITAELFFQKHPETRMPGLRELDPALWPGHAALLAVDTPEALVAAAQMNVVEFHTWNSTTRHIDKPDRVIFDLDPGEGVAWPQLQEAALLMHTLLTELGLQAWLKTSGGKGLHVVVPLASRLAYDKVKAFSQAAVQHMARTIPQRFVAKSGGGNRVGKIFIDYLRNGHGQTTAVAFSARARPGMGVSMPVDWAQLPALKGGAQWTIATAREYLSFQQQDPWAGYWTCRQTLGAALKKLPPTGAAAG